MKVKELIEKLQTLDPDLNVLIRPYELLSWYEANLENLVFVKDENITFEDGECNATVDIERNELMMLPGVVRSD